MAITLYTAPNCLRCGIVKSFLNAKGVEYQTVDFQAEVPVFNAFYREHRAEIYRNPEGVEFPLYYDEIALRQGAGVILAYLLGFGTLDEAVVQSKLLHGWISGLNLSLCPVEQEGKFVELVTHLKKGGLQVCISTDGRNPALLRHLSAVVDRCELNVLGSAKVYEQLFGQALELTDLAETLELMRSFKESQICYDICALTQDGVQTWAEPEQAKAAAKMLAEASGNKQLPCFVRLPEPVAGLEPLPDSVLFKYRTAMREYLFKADILK